jgi:hypothetical protein
MSVEASPSGWKRFLPLLDRPLWRALFAASIMLNLLIGGVMLGNTYGSGRFDRIYSPSIVQVVPRQFIQALPRQRRLELLRGVRPGMEDLRKIRQGTSESVLALARELENDTGSLAGVRTALQNYATGAESAASKGVDVVIGLIEKLSPEERKSMAAAIRDRAAKNEERDKLRREAN